MPSNYHFAVRQAREDLILGSHFKVSGHVCQYLKDFQLDAIQFLFKHFLKDESCILNDDSGFGKAVVTAVFLDAILAGTNKKCLIVVKDSDYVENWLFHIDIFTKLSAVEVKAGNDETNMDKHSVFVVSWTTLKSKSKKHCGLNYDYVILDNRGCMLANMICRKLLCKHFRNKVSTVIMSNDITLDLGLLHYVLDLCGRLDKQYSTLKAFEDKFGLPEVSGLSRKLEQFESYFLRREKIINFCREFRLRRGRYEHEESLPLVTKEEHDRSLQIWRDRPIQSSLASLNLQISSSEKDTEELFRTFFAMKNETALDKNPTEIADNFTLAEDEPLVMSPLIFEEESDNETDKVLMQKPAKTPKKQTRKRIEDLTISFNEKYRYDKVKAARGRVTRATAGRHGRKFVPFDGGLDRIKKRRMSTTKRVSSVNEVERDLIEKKQTEIVENEKKNSSSQESDLGQNAQTFSQISSLKDQCQPLNELPLSNFNNFSLELNRIQDLNEVTFVRSPEEEVIVLASSTEDEELATNPRSGGNTKQKKTHKKPKNLKRHSKTNPRTTIQPISPSPDLFSDEASLTCSQRNPKTTFDGFKIFGSEVQRKDTRSCLEMLENDFDRAKSLSPRKPEQYRSTASNNLPPDDAQFEITVNSTFGNVLRVTENDDVSPLKGNAVNKITKYFTGTHGTQLEELQERECPKTPKRRKSIASSARKSPKASGSKNTTPQSNKLTQWLVRNAATNQEEPEQPSMSRELNVKRRRLDLSFQ